MMEPMMHRKILPLRSLLLSLFLALFLLGLPVASQTLVELGIPEGLGDVLRRGRELEYESRWGDALTHYEDAIRKFPGDQALQGRFDSCRLHYNLTRRYGDDSFCDLLTRLSLAEALEVYDEVLLKIDAHYVELCSWKELVEQGTNSFEVALAEPLFLSRHAPNADRQTLDKFRQELRRTLGPRLVQTRRDAGEAVLVAAELAQQRLGVPPVSTVLEFTCGAAASLDPYSICLTPNQLDDVYSQIEGNYVGLGIELKAEAGALLIVRVIPGSPALEAGILQGDRILAVDGHSTANVTTDEAANLLQGEAGTVVQLTLATPAQPPRELLISRRRIEVPSVDEVQILDSAAGVAYLKLTCFQKTTGRDLEKALWQLHEAGMRSLIIDLRHNPGGLLITAVEVADKFLRQGTIVSTRGRSSHEDATYRAHRVGTWQVPLVVVIDEDSASAAEIFAGAIRDHQRGTIVGSRSYGKGSVQGIFPLSFTSAGIRLTTAKFYSPDGHPYSRIGVEPDVVVALRARPIDGSVETALNAVDEDPYVTAAILAARRLTVQ